jgi:hypothetical protein
MEVMDGMFLVPDIFSTVANLDALKYFLANSGIQSGEASR